MTVKQFISEYGFRSCTELTDAQQVFVIAKISNSQKISDELKTWRVKSFMLNHICVEDALTTISGDRI